MLLTLTGIISLVTGVTLPSCDTLLTGVTVTTDVVVVVADANDGF